MEDIINEKISIEYEYQDNIIMKEVMGTSLKDFNKIRILEQDKNSTIYLERSKINYNQYVIKEISQNLFDKYKSEIEFFLKAKHPNIVKCFNYFQEDGYIYIVMEFMDENLENFVINYNDSGLKIGKNVLLNIIYQSLYALEYIQNENQERNIRLKNVFIDENFNIKIGIMSIYSIDIICPQICALGRIIEKLFNICEINDANLFNELKFFIGQMKEQKIDIKSAKEYFINHFLKDSSIKAIFHCLNNFKSFRNYFSNNNDSILLSKNIYENKLILDIIKNLNKADITEEEKKNSYYELRKYFAKDELFVKNNNIEVSPENLTYIILEQLYNELYDHELQKNIKGNLKEEKDICFFQKTFNKQELLEFEKRFNIFKAQKYSSFSSNFMSFFKTKNVCQHCNGEKINYSWSYFISIAENDFIKEKNNINDILNDTRFLDGMTNKICGICRNLGFYETKLCYIIAKNLIIFLKNYEKSEGKAEINFDGALKLKNEFTKKEFTYELKGIISKGLNEGDYIYYIKNESNMWNSSKRENICFDKYNKNEKAIALFYERKEENLEDNNYLKNPLYNFQEYKISNNINYLELQSHNSDLSEEINNNGNNNNYILSIPNNNNNLSQSFNNNNTFNNNNNSNQSYRSHYGQQGINFQLMKNNFSTDFNQQNYQPLNLNNNNHFNSSNKLYSMNNFMNKQQSGINNINNKIYQKFFATQNTYSNNLNKINNNINENKNIAYSSSNSLLNQNKILPKEDEIPKYFEGKKNNKIEYIPGKILDVKIKELS